MRKSLLKSIVATAVVGATMAITSVAAFAATNTYYYVEDSEGTVNTESFFAVTGGGAASSGLTSEFSFEDESTAYTPK